MDSTLRFALALLLVSWAPAFSQGVPPGFVEVKPVSRSVVQPPTLRLASGRFFTYALPPGWRVGEDGQFALTLLAPDNKAITVMVGNAGMPRVRRIVRQ